MLLSCNNEMYGKSLETEWLLLIKMYAHKSSSECTDIGLFRFNKKYTVILILAKMIFGG